MPPLVPVVQVQAVQRDLGFGGEQVFRVHGKFYYKPGMKHEIKVYGKKQKINQIL